MEKKKKIYRSWTPEAKEKALKIVFSKMAKGESCFAIFKEKNEDLPGKSMFDNWIKEPLISDRYARAKEQRAEYIFEDILNIADDSTKDTLHTDRGEVENKEWVNRSRLRIDSRKWMLSKMMPKTYGDKLDFTTGGYKVIQPIFMVQDKQTAEDLQDLKK